MDDNIISRQDAIDYLMTNMNWYDEDGCESDDDYKRECITELINGVPPAEPKRGKWIFGFGDEWNCSKCDYLIHTDGSWEHPTSIGYKFCPNCGKRMEVDNG